MCSRRVFAFGKCMKWLFIVVAIKWIYHKALTYFNGILTICRLCFYWVLDTSFCLMQYKFTTVSKQKMIRIKKIQFVVHFYYGYSTISEHSEHSIILIYLLIRL